MGKIDKLGKEKMNILILFGGKSTEHEVSCISAASVLRVINRDKYQINTIGITKTGQWLWTDASPDEIEKGSWIDRETNLNISVKFGEEVVLIGSKIVESENSEDTATRIFTVDCIFPILHGQNGEDGTIQGMMEIMRIPYVGCGTMSSAVCMDKMMTKRIIENTGKILQTKYVEASRGEFMTNPMGVLNEIHEKLKDDYPLFVKPANGGSSVGITKVKNKDALFDAIRLAAEMDDMVIVEKGVVGREIEVGVLGNLKIKSTNPGEVISSNVEIYDYEAKYHSGESKTRMVDYISEEFKKEIREEAEFIYKELRCRGLARIDFFLTENNEVIFNEINTMPGFTKTSMYPKMWESMGLTYEKLIDMLIDLALYEV